MLSKQYEFLLISDGALTQEENKVVLDRHQEVITKAGGKILAVVDWGRRKTAYTLGKKNQGIYQFLYIEGNGSVIEEAEKQMGYDESVLKYFVTAVKDYQVEKKEFEALLADPQKNAKLITDVIGA